MRDEQESDKRSKIIFGGPRFVPISETLERFAKELQETQEAAALRKQVEVLTAGMLRLLAGEYATCAASVEATAKAVVESDNIPLDAGARLLVTKCIRELADQHLSHSDPMGALRAVDLLLELARKDSGNHRDEITTLSFERVLALKLVREQQGARNPELDESYMQAIRDTRRMALQEECGLTTATRGHILVTLGKSLFYTGAWDDAKSTLTSALHFTTKPEATAASFMMLAQISHYQGESAEAAEYIREIKNMRFAIPPELQAIADDIVQNPIQYRESNDAPALQCIKDTLQRGYALLESEQLLGAQSTFEGALSMIEHQYGCNHYLASTALTLLCKSLADRAYHCLDAEERSELYGKAREYALRAFDLLKAQDLDRPRQRQVLEYAQVISAALNDQREVARISRMLDSDLF